ncbi:amidohydrolase family protein [Nocardioides sp. LMS-CY]|uniref:N-acyl-D-amino-acid deacylase family protein n=1 Tax=Nocardioides sp. (strain LMS-CY) TaxID=2840457 RepID=UPI001C00475B|nr:amidohydrolase family protein [Nocardioides sp. LMS-CY]QWF20736.1 amidohydrolase family protein [Nocardioides sp. LMS-CY]
MTTYLLRGGLIVDGTGNPGYRADLAIEEGTVRIVRRPKDAPVGATQIDVSGLVVAPGFIDMHSHTGLTILDEPQHSPKLTQGVTTELVGVDGLSYAPFETSKDLELFARMNAGLDGLPEIAFDWGSVDSYLRRFDVGVGVNVAMLMGNSALRIAAVGWDEGEASAEQIATMRRLVGRGMREGAFGISTGLDYPPGSYASTDELVELCREVYELGGLYHTHVRYWLGDRHLDPFKEAFEISERSGARLHVTHMYTRDYIPDGVGALVGLLDETYAGGVDVSFDVYPFEWTGTRSTIYLPQWIQSGGPDETLRRLADPECRRRFVQDLTDADPRDSWRTQMDYVFVGYLAGGKNEKFESWTLGEIARYRGVDVVDAFFDLLIDEDLRVAEVLSPGPPGNRLQTFLTHPLGMIGTDAMYLGDRPSPRSYGSFTRILGEFVRGDSMMPLTEAIRRFTSYPAQRLGLKQRGMLRDGLVADVTVFDPATVRSNATHAHPRTESTGIEHVFVNGEQVLRDGALSGRLAGRALRFGND